MTLLQLEYIIAVDTYGSFVAAAEKSFVTQPTLSMQIQKLEETLGVKLFNRSVHPVEATEIGKKVIQQARVVLAESQRIQDLINDEKGELAGDLRVGVIPTVAPYLLPQIVPAFTKKYPDIKLHIWEYTTAKVVKMLKNGLLECGLLSTPLNDHEVEEIPLYYESFVAYVSEKSPLFQKRLMRVDDIAEEKLWLLNEGHCMRGQVLNICNYRQAAAISNSQIEYNTGSIETLINMVDVNGGLTILPELSIAAYNENQMKRIRYFRSPEPVREISLVVPQVYAKKKMVQAFQKAVEDYVPEHLKSKKKKELMAFDL